jgi:hypothetical protein
MAGLALPDVVRELLRDPSVLVWHPGEEVYEVMDGTLFERRYALAPVPPFRTCEPLEIMRTACYPSARLRASCEQVQRAPQGAQQAQVGGPRAALQPHVQLLHHRAGRQMG